MASQQASADAQHAQDLHQAEMGQRSGRPEVLQGVPVEPPRGPVLLGAARNAGPPNDGSAWATKPTVDIPEAEVAILSYGMAISCFATIDIITTLLNGLSLMHGVWWGFYSFFLLIGPFCGFFGASSLNRCLVGVYFAFCIVKVAYEIVLLVLIGMFSSWAFIWAGCFAIVQFWIMKIVGTFWAALGEIPPQRRKELAEIDDAPSSMVYW